MGGQVETQPLPGRKTAAHDLGEQSLVGETAEKLRPQLFLEGARGHGLAFLMVPNTGGGIVPDAL